MNITILIGDPLFKLHYYYTTTLLHYYYTTTTLTI
jgi:hypothetical protein